MISFSEFQKMELVVGEVKECREHPNADRLLLLRVSVGDGEKQIVAGIREHYSPEEIVGKKVVVLNNLEPVTLRGERSEGMVLAGTNSSGSVVLLTVDRDIEPGTKIS
ncbi:MAG: methionine--tRNA ligase subunit beta [Planctomycetota bacterium]|nr:methionine--tRNA ligase subunit beta [Planctomycetota bacterium]